MGLGRCGTGWVRVNSRIGGLCHRRHIPGVALVPINGVKFV